jgi:hypothetical protein
MAVAVTGSVSISPWINEKNTLAAYDGLHLNRFRESLTGRDSGGFIFTCILSYVLFPTLSRAEHKLSPERVTAYAWGLFPDPRGPYFYAALLLAVLNTTKLSNQSPPLKANAQVKNPPTQSAPTGMDRFLVVVSKATPYLMIITNIAVTIIQIRRGESSAWVTLAFTGITLIDIASWKPKNYMWYVDTVLGYPVAAAAFYYSDNKGRFAIVCSLALSLTTIQKIVVRTQLPMILEMLEVARKNKMLEEKQIAEMRKSLIDFSK